MLTEIHNEVIIRLVFFFSILLMVGCWESIATRRTLTVPRFARWCNNFGIIFLDTLLVKLLLSVTAVGMAAAMEVNGWGLLNYYEVSNITSTIIGVLVLDLAIYLQHLMFHAVPLLWRLHMVHHADLDFDVSTGLRFHPIEVLISTGIKIGVVATVGPPPLMVRQCSIMATSGCQSLWNEF